MGNNDLGMLLVQLGSREIEAAALEEAGVSWEEIVTGRFPEENMLPPRARDEFPLRGWRSLHTSYPSWASEVLVLAAPSEVRPGRWVLVQLSQDKNGWQFATPGSYAPVPVREVRRQGLRLEWSKTTFSMAKGTQPEIAVVLGNEAASPWNATEEDHGHVQGIVLDHEGNRIGNGWYAHGKVAQLPPLGPGEQTVLPAFLNNPELDGLESGSYQILATLTAVGLRTTAPAGLTVL